MPLKLLYDCGANWLYATQMPMSDPAYWLQDATGKTHMLASTRDIAEAKEKAAVDSIHPYPKAEILRQFNGSMPASLVKWWLQEIGADANDEIVVPKDFPAAFFVELKDLDVNITTTWKPFFPERAIKTADEIEKLRTAQRVNELGFHRVEEILRESTIGAEDVLAWNGATLTSEILRAEMCKTQLDAGCTGFNDGPIVAGGAHSATPHERGHGPLKAHTFILVDSFPTHPNHYVGDLTRTYLKGTADAWHTGVYNAVLAAQEGCIAGIKAGADGGELHTSVMKTLEELGYPAGMDDNGHPYGMIHGTGHGVGLDVHDEPVGGCIGGRGFILEAGMVTSVEPGLYYPGKAGCRIEDVGAVTADGFDNFTVISKTDWIIS